MEQNGMIGRSRRTVGEIKELLGTFEKSDLTVIEFCKQHNLNKGTFHHWRNRYGMEVAAHDTGFAALQIAPVGSSGEYSLFAEVRGIRIYQPVAAAYLKELLG